MKRFWRISGAVLGVGVVAVSVFAVNLLFFKPFFINHFFERTFLTFALNSPEALTATRILKPLGLRFYHDDLADLSEERAFENLEFFRESYEVLRSYDSESLTGQKLLSKQILEAFLEPQLELIPFRYHDYPVNQLFGYQNTWPSFMTDQHWVEDEGDAEAYISRLKKVEVAFEQLIEGIRIREEKGIVPPTFVVDKVLGNIKAFREPAAKEHALYTEFASKLETAEIDNPALLEQVESAIEGSVYPSYDRLAEFFTELRPRTNTDDGVWKFPDGEKFYDLCLWQQTTTRTSADAIHKRGLEEVDRIQGEMLKILEEQGYEIEDGFAAAMEQLSADEKHYFEDSDAGREAILERYRALIEEIEGKLEPWFRRRHKATVEVKRVPEFREKTAPGAYYNGPSLDGEEPGRFYANLYDMKATPRWGMRTLAYHEAVPGHHLQVSVNAELEGVPTFRRILPFTAFSEGWALYAERLAWEMGLESDPLDNLGRLQAELFRAVRLVVDTGIHRFKWSREKSIEYMVANLGNAPSDAEAEIERYIVNPGQATAYKVGMDFILGLRDKAKSKLGDAFDIRDFHDAVLENGSVPLSILEAQIDAYIARASS